MCILECEFIFQTGFELNIKEDRIVVNEGLGVDSRFVQESRA